MARLPRQRALGIFVFLWAATSFAQTPDASDLLRTALVNYQQRQIQTKDYEYHEHETRVTGNLHVRSDTTYEIMIVDGRQLRRKLGSGVPLSPEVEATEKRKNLENAKKEVDQQVLQHVVRGAIIGGVDDPTLALQDIPAFFEAHLVKEEMLEGRNTCVLEARPRKGEKPSDQVESDLRTFKLRLWIDLADRQIVQLEAVAIHPGLLGYPSYARFNPRKPDAQEAERWTSQHREQFSKGTRITMEWRKINDEAWLPSRIHLKGNYLLPIYRTPFESIEILGDGSDEQPFDVETVFSDYQKFSVTHRMIPEKR